MDKQSFSFNLNIAAVSFSEDSQARAAVNDFYRKQDSSHISYDTAKQLHTTIFSRSFLQHAGLDIPVETVAFSFTGLYKIMEVIEMETDILRINELLASAQAGLIYMYAQEGLIDLSYKMSEEIFEISYTFGAFLYDYTNLNGEFLFAIPVIGHVEKPKEKVLLPRLKLVEKHQTVKVTVVDPVEFIVPSMPTLTGKDFPLAKGRYNHNLKVLEGEMAFINDIQDKNNMSLRKVIYLGSAPGNHFDALLTCFPRLQILAIDISPGVYLSRRIEPIDWTIPIDGQIKSFLDKDNFAVISDIYHENKITQMELTTGYLEMMPLDLCLGVSEKGEVLWTVRDTLVRRSSIFRFQVFYDGYEMRLWTFEHFLEMVNKSTMELERQRNYYRRKVRNRLTKHGDLLSVVSNCSCHDCIVLSMTLREVCKNLTQAKVDLLFDEIQFLLNGKMNVFKQEFDDVYHILYDRDAANTLQVFTALEDDFGFISSVKNDKGWTINFNYQGQKLKLSYATEISVLPIDSISFLPLQILKYGDKFVINPARYWAEDGLHYRNGENGWKILPDVTVWSPPENPVCPECATNFSPLIAPWLLFFVKDYQFSCGCSCKKVVEMKTNSYIDSEEMMEEGDYRLFGSL